MTILFGSYTIGSTSFDVTLEDDNIGCAVYVNEQLIPSGRFWDAYLNNVDSVEELCKVAGDSSVFGINCYNTLVVTDKAMRDGDTFIASDEEAGWVAVKRNENMRIRPYMVGTMCRFEVEPKQDMIVAVCSYMQYYNRIPLGYVDRKLFFVREDNLTSTLEYFGLTEKDIGVNVHLSTRVAVLMKRPGAAMIGLRPSSNLFDEKDNDGTIMITDDVQEAFPGTMRVVTSEGNLFYKGMVRPPLVDLGTGVVEDESMCRDAQLGKTLDVHDINEIEFSPVRTMPGEFASVNYQAVMFGHRDPASYIREDTKRNYEDRSLLDILTPSDREKVDAGVPPALLLGQYAPWSWVTKFVPEQAARATVYGSMLVSSGSGVKLFEKTWKRLGSPKVGTFLTLHRDPAVPDGSSAALYRYEGLVGWTSGEYRDGIVLNPSSLSWKNAGGDFDGDAAVAFRGQVGEWTVRHDRQHQPLKTAVKTRCTTYADGTVAWAPTIASTISGFTALLGSSVNLAMRLRELGPLDAEVASHAQCVIQGAVDAKKHPVNARRGNKMYAEMKDTVDLVEPEDGFILDQLQLLRNAKGFDNKVLAWGKLVEFARANTDSAAVVRALCDRIIAIDNLFAKTTWLRGSRVGLASDMRKTAAAEVMRMPNARPQLKLVKDMANMYRDLIRQTNDPELSEVEQQMVRDRAFSVRTSMKAALALGDLHPWAMVAYAPHKMAAELVSAEDFEALNKTVRYVECGLNRTFAGNLPTDLDVEFLAEHLVAKDKARVLALVGDSVDVTLCILKEYANSLRVALAW